MSNAQDTKKQDEAKTFTIIVNGQAKVVTKKEMSFEEIVALSYDGTPPTGSKLGLHGDVSSRGREQA